MSLVMNSRKRLAGAPSSSDGRYVLHRPPVCPLATTPPRARDQKTALSASGTGNFVGPFFRIGFGGPPAVFGVAAFVCARAHRTLGTPWRVSGPPASVRVALTLNPVVRRGAVSVCKGCKLMAVLTFG